MRLFGCLQSSPRWGRGLAHSVSEGGKQGFRCGLLIKWLMLWPLAGFCLPLHADGLSESQIKAAYLYNFAKFVEWPPGALSADAEIVLCAVGNNILDGSLDSLNGRTVGNRQFRVVQRNFSELPFTGCNLLFIGKSEQQRFLVILKSLGNLPVLTLSDIDDFAEKGGAIGLLFRDNKVVFEVNLEPIRGAGLRLPSQLLNIATYVYGR